jgi:hypothetical protein
MESTQFCYWLQGFFELSNPAEITAEQTQMIKNHLNLVFFHDIDPKASNDPKVQDKMNQIHNGEILPMNQIHNGEILPINHMPNNPILRC